MSEINPNENLNLEPNQEEDNNQLEQSLSLSDDNLQETKPSLEISQAEVELEQEESELDSILDDPAPDKIKLTLDPLKNIDDDLEQKKENLRAEIRDLENYKNQLLAQQKQVQENIVKMVEEGVKELEQKRQSLEISIQKLERRQERIKEEMRTTFAGVSQDLAIRIQGFKDYLVGSLQDLAAAAEQLELPTATFQSYESSISQSSTPETNLTPQFADNSFKDVQKKIRSLLDQYRTRPDYYGPPWQLRRTFEPIHAERVSNWFFSQGGKGAIPSMGSRLQNILVASSVISILFNLYGDRFRTLLLSNTPERLGDWRRGLQDCLGISRSDFGPNQGVVLFENPEALSQKAERLIERKELPLIIIDQADEGVSLSLLQFPLWLAFASEPQAQSSNYFY
jgi:small-conductance mechanosensitive channel